MNLMKTMMQGGQVLQGGPTSLAQVVSQGVGEVAERSTEVILSH